MDKILELEKNDDIASIRSRIETVFPPPLPTEGLNDKPERKRLLLIIPRKNKAMQSLVNMKLLARIANNKAIEIAVVSNQPLVRDYAKAAKVKAFGSLTAAKLAGWVKSQAPVVPPESSLPPAAPLSGSETAGPARPKKKPAKPKKYVVIQGSGRVGILQQLGALIVLVVLAGALIFAVIGLLPQATVTLVPVAQPVEAELVVKADPEIESVDFQTLTFPASPTQVELALSGQIETIKTELAPVGKAEGFVTFINRTEEPQTIPVSTTVSTSAGEPVEFFTTATTTIPPGDGVTTSTLVIAVEPGPRGNVGPAQISRFENSRYGVLVRVVNEQAFSGGTMEPAKIVEDSDKERLQAHLRQKVQQEGLAQIQASLAPQEFIPPESVQVIVLDVSYNEFAGDFSDSFSGEMQAVVRGTVVGGYNANRLALAALESQVPPGYDLELEGLHFAAGEVLDIQDRVVSFRVFANGRVTPVIDQNQVAQDIAWLPIGEAQARLSQQYQLANVPGIELEPAWLVDWLGRLPYLPLRIKVVVNEAVTSIVDGG